MNFVFLLLKKRTIIIKDTGQYRYSLFTDNICARSGMRKNMIFFKKKYICINILPRTCTGVCIFFSILCRD